MVEFVCNQLSDAKTAVKVVPVFKDKDIWERIGDFVKAKDANRLKTSLEKRAFRYNDGEVMALDDGEQKYVLAAAKPRMSAYEMQQWGAKIVRGLRREKEAEIFVPAEWSSQAADLALGVELELYSFDKYFTTKKDADFNQLETVYLYGEKNIEEAQLAEAKALANGVRYARDLANEAPNYLTPETFALDIKRLEYLGLQVEVIPTEELKEKGFALTYEVGKESVNQPYAVIVKWLGKPKQKDFDAALIGKGVTFDAGGVNLKTAKGLEDMKMDMSGAAAVMAVMKVAALRKMKLNLVALAGLAENMIGGKAYKPQDVLFSASGLTVEVGNSDAEGRMLLADCLWYATDKLKAKTVIDVATLTGAVANTLAGVYAGLFCENEALSEALLKAGKNSGEKLWQMPMAAEYEEKIKSDIADVCHIGNGGAGGSTAAAFLKRFVKGKTAWAHLDIAGCEVIKKPKPMYPKGAAGFGVKLLYEYLKGLK